MNVKTSVKKSIIPAELIANVRASNKKELFKIGTKIGQEAVELTPVGETGNLRNSMVVDPSRENNADTVVISFGADYAVFVHENLEANHRVGQALFLEKAVRENKDFIKGFKKSLSKTLQKAISKEIK